MSTRVALRSNGQACRCDTEVLASAGAGPGTVGARMGGWSGGFPEGDYLPILKGEPVAPATDE